MIREGWDGWLRACLGAICLAALLVHPAFAEVPEVPIRVQAELLAKVAGYDRTFTARARGLAVVLIAVRPNDPDSQRTADELVAELAHQAAIGQSEHREHVVRYTNAEALAAESRARGASIVYLSTGFNDEAARIAASLGQTNVLTVTAIGRDVPRGVVLGFSVQSGKPKILINLAQARLQGLDFRSDLLKLAKVLP